MKDDVVTEDIVIRYGDDPANFDSVSEAVIKNPAEFSIERWVDFFKIKVSTTDGQVFVLMIGAKNAGNVGGVVAVGGLAP